MLLIEKSVLLFMDSHDLSLINMVEHKANKKYYSLWHGNQGDRLAILFQCMSVENI
jgi:hypothetical protein